MDMLDNFKVLAKFKFYARRWFKTAESTDLIAALQFLEQSCAVPKDVYETVEREIAKQEEDAKEG